ncbi:MAG: transglycosylase SLT domain-containing protein [Bacteroidales bacterium]|nr:transglycosylase SLT domain-containing protein [Bacteroidales bacterium]
MKQLLREPHSLAVLLISIMLIAASALAGAIAPRTPEVEPEPDSAPALPRGMSAQYVISPYDSLIKVYSDSAGLDWRLVSAIVYHESGFDNDVRSRRGAAGLMQMMPSTAEVMGADDLSDPIQSVKAGVKYLGHLRRSVNRHVQSPSERLKFMLASYNAGTGRILDCINYARYRGVDSLSWDAVVELIPEMSSDEILELDTIRFGKFKGVETIAYVQKVLDKYEEYKRRAAK